MMKVFSAVAVSALLLTGCAGMGGVSMGSSKAKTTATGSAGGANAAGANSALERCQRPLGTMALLEDRSSSWYGTMSKHGIRSTTPILRLLAQQSNCFVVVERGAGFKAMTRERELMESGELRSTSNFGKGQMVSADYTLTPSLIFNSNNTGGIGGLGWVGALVGAAAKFKDAQALLTLVENRSGVQLAAAEGSARASDLAGILGIFGGGAGGVLGGYTRTPEGKVIVGAMTDAFNNLVKAVRSYKAQESSGPQGHGSGGRLEVK